MMRSIFSYWHFGFATIAFIAGLILLYFYVINFKLRKQSLYFFAAIILLIFCVASPLHFIGENYLFSAHMLSHVLIILIAGPLIVAGIPEENKLKKSLHLFSKTIMKIPFICWFTGVGMMWLWHVPYLFNQLFSMHGMALMHIETFSLLIAGIIFSWPIINPCRECRIAPMTSVLYLSTACVFCSLLGLMITFAPVGIYSHYLNIMDMYGYLPMIRNGWRISAAADQQIAGLIMWVPCCFIYLSASMIILIKWFDETRSNSCRIAPPINPFVQIHEIKIN